MATMIRKTTMMVGIAVRMIFSIGFLVMKFCLMGRVCSGLRRIRLQLAIYFLLQRGKTSPKRQEDKRSHLLGESSFDGVYKFHIHNIDAVPVMFSTA